MNLVRSHWSEQADCNPKSPDHSLESELLEQASDGLWSPVNARVHVFAFVPNSLQASHGHHTQQLLKPKALDEQRSNRIDICSIAGLLSMHAMMRVVSR